MVVDLEEKGHAKWRIGFTNRAIGESEGMEAGGWGRGGGSSGGEDGSWRRWRW